MITNHHLFVHFINRFSYQFKNIILYYQGVSSKSMKLPGMVLFLGFDLSRGVRHRNHEFRTTRVDRL